MLAAALVIFIQTDTFNRWVLDFTLEKINENTYEDVHINAIEINGNILQGLTLKNGSIIVKGDTLMKFNYMETEYDIWKALHKEIRLKRVILNSPYISAHKIKDSSGSIIWNYEKIFLPKLEEPDTTITTFDWDINIEHFKLENGFIRINGDSALTPLDPVWKAPRSQIENFDLNNTDISNLEIELNGSYRKDIKDVSVKNISFATNSVFFLKSLKFDINLNENDTSLCLKDLELITPRSNVKINKLCADKFNPFGVIAYENFGEMNIDADIDTKKFNFDDLVFFLPWLDFLDSTASLKLTANGKYGDLNINELVVKTNNTLLNAKGKIQNLHDPEQLFIDVFLENFNIYPRDVKAVYKNDLVPDYSQLAPVTGNIHYKGSYLNFAAVFDIHTSGGSAEGNIALDINNEAYNGFVTANSLNLGKILKDHSLNSRLNLTAKFNGSGFEPRDMNTNLEYSITGSTFSKYDIRRSAGKVHFVRDNISMNIMYASTIGSGIVAGRINIANINNPVYNLKGSVSNLDLSGITKSETDKSSLNFAFDVNGRGIEPDKLNGSYVFNIENSKYSEYTVPKTTVEAKIEGFSENSSLAVINEMIDIKAEGNLNFGNMVKILKYNIDKINSSILMAVSPDTVNDQIGIISGYPSENLELNYRIITKDSSKLSQFLSPFRIGFNGNITGSISNSAEQFTNVTKMDIKNFSYKDTVIILANVKSDIDYRNTYLLQNSPVMFDGMKLKLNTTGDKILLSNINIDSASVNLNIAGDNKGTLNVSGKQDSTNSLKLSSDITFTSDNVALNIDTVKVLYAGYEAQNEGLWVLNYFPDNKVEIGELNIKSRNARLNVKGVYSFNENSDISVSSAGLKLSDVLGIIDKTDSASDHETYNGINGEFTKLLITYKGTAEDPELNAQIETNSFTYDDEKIGFINANAAYKDNNLKADILIQNNNNKGSLTIKADIPYLNPLSRDTSSVIDTINANMKMNLQAKDFILDYYSLLVPSISTLRGVLNADLTAEGTVHDPNLLGTLTVKNGAYLFPLTGMDYSFDLKISTGNSKLILENLKIYNEDDLSRHIDLSGSLDFKDMKIKDIDLAATGDMILLDPSVEENDLGIYGYLLGGVGDPQIKVTGSLDSFFVTGQFLVKKANITSLPLEGKGYNPEDDNFIYVNSMRDTSFIPDTIKALTPEDFANINPFERYRYFVSKESKNKSTVGLNLNVKTTDNVYVNIDFNNLTRDRLFGEIKADLDIKTHDGEYQAFGLIDVMGNSYYRFYRDFKVSESQIKFDGPISNPVLNLKAVYEDQKTIEQAGITSTSEIAVEVTITGEVKHPEIRLKLYQDGAEVSGSDAQSDAVTYLIFGRFKSELNSAERTSVASSLGTSVGSLYISSYLSQSIREVLPFIVDAEFKYTEGDVNNSDIELQSELGDAKIKFGGKLLKDVKNIDLVVQYPVNKLLSLELPETLLLEFSREEKNQSLGGIDYILTTELKLLYKIKF